MSRNADSDGVAAPIFFLLYAVTMDWQFGSLTLESRYFQDEAYKSKMKVFHSEPWVSQSTSRWKIRFTNTGNLWMTSKWGTDRLSLDQEEECVWSPVLGRRGQIRIQYGGDWAPETGRKSPLA